MRQDISCMASSKIPLTVHGIQKLNLITPFARANTNVVKDFLNLELADKEFWVPQEVDLLIVANIQLLKPEVIIRKGIVAQRTAMG